MSKIRFYSGKNKPVSLDTLAQLETSAKKGENSEDSLELSAVTTVDNKQALIKRARRKYLGTGLSLRLADAAKLNPKGLLGKSYYNTYHCAKTLLLYPSGKVTSSYCKNRWCMVCNSIRTAKLINQYRPILENWDDKYFVTLTVPNVPAPALPRTIDRMQYNFNRVRKRVTKRGSRGSKIKLIGLRKMECTYNANRNDYHPHYHFIIRGKSMAKMVVDMWLEYYPDANRKAQDFRPADNNSCIEMFKYFTKVISKTKKGDKRIYADAMDIIFNSIRKRRTFQSFGFVVKKEVGEAAPTDVEDDLYADVYTWYQLQGDWIDITDGVGLTGYEPSEGMRDLVKKIMVRDLHK